MAYTDVELILDQLEDIKDISSAELSLIEQLSVKMLPDKVVNQSSRLKGAMANPVTASNGISKYINLRITAINQAISEIKSKWNEVIPLSTSDITTLKTRLDTLTMGVNDEYNTLLKIENAIKKEVSDREQAITNLINEASEDFNTLKKIETKVKQEISDREQAITDLINGASSGYDTLKELETAIKKEVSDRSNAITNLINNATTNYNTLGKLETRIKEETANRNSAVSAIKGTATSSNDTLGKIETNLNNEISNRENAIETIYDEVKNNYVDKDTFKNYNLKFGTGYGLVTNEEYYGGKIGFNDEGYPCFVGSFGERTIAVSPSTLVDDYNFYTFPEKNGTLALQEDVDLIKNSLINFKQKTIQVQKSIPARSFYTVTDEFEKKVLIIGVHISALVMDRIFCGMPRCIYESPKIFRFDLYNSSEYETKVSYLSITYIELE